MTAGSKVRFDVDALKSRAGGTVLARGEVYHRDGRVRILSVEPARVLAVVEGSEDYTVALSGRGGVIDGECSCPAFADQGICKHIVATALAADALGDDELEGSGALARIRDHLKTKSLEALIEMIVGLAEADPALFRKLDLAATARSADDKTLKAKLKAAIDGATRTGVTSITKRRGTGRRASTTPSMRSQSSHPAPARALRSNSPSARSNGSRRL
jgi:uncharacterized Zn finger protein